MTVIFSFSAIRREPRPVRFGRAGYGTLLDLTSAGPPFGPVPASVDRPSLVIFAAMRMRVRTYASISSLHALTPALSPQSRGEGAGARGVLSLRKARRSPAACHSESRSDRGQLALSRSMRWSGRDTGCNCANLCHSAPRRRYFARFPAASARNFRSGTINLQETGEKVIR